MKNKQNKKYNRTSGFTLDQTILVVAVIAILATIIISSVAWSVLNRANATKIASHLSQAANSIGNYYQDYSHDWPDNAAKLAPYLAGYTVTASGDKLISPFGTSTDISEMALESEGASLSKTGGSFSSLKCVSGDKDCYIVITLSNIQIQEAKEANNAIDGEAEATPNTQGRLRWDAGSAAKDVDRVTLVYYAVKQPL